MEECRKRQRGKDTTIGHWEIAGIVSLKRLFLLILMVSQKQFWMNFQRGQARENSLQTSHILEQMLLEITEKNMFVQGNLIVYTSADSVFQIAAHEDIVPVEEL